MFGAPRIGAARLGAGIAMKLASPMYGASSVDPAGLAYDDPKVEGEHLASVGTVDDASLKKSLCFFEHEASGGLILDWENGSKVEVFAHFEDPVRVGAIMRAVAVYCFAVVDS